MLKPLEIIYIKEREIFVLLYILLLTVIAVNI
jgi:hypothetical protein